MKPFNVRALHNPLTPSRLLFLFRTTARHIVDDIPLIISKCFRCTGRKAFKGGVGTVDGHFILRAPVWIGVLMQSMGD